MQGFEHLPSRDPAIGLGGEREALLVVQLGDDSVDSGIHPVDLLQAGFHELSCRKLAPANQAGPALSRS